MSVTLAVTFGQRSGSAWVEDTTNYSATLKLVEVNALYAQQAPTSTDSHGNWLFAGVLDGIYRYELSGSILTKYGTFKIGCSDAVLTTGDQTIAGIKRFTYQAVFSAGNGLKTDLIAENTSGAGVTIDGLKIQDGNIQTAVEFEDTATFTTSVTFTDPPTCEASPGGVYELANKEYVDAQVALIPVSVFQPSMNVLRVIPNGTEVIGSIYLDYETALNYANGYADTNTRYTIEMSSGDGVNYFDLTSAGFPGLNGLESYISVKGINQNIYAYIQDESVTITEGTSIVENLTMYMTGGSGTPVYNGIIFKDCFFDLNVTSITFVNCHFRGVNTVKLNAGTATYTTCKGGVVLTNGTLPAEIVGWDNITITDL
jgi:hypothetical protein